MLMGQHDRRLDVALVRKRVVLDCLDVWKRLKAVFAHETRPLFFVFAERLFSVPDFPVMHVAAAPNRIVFEPAMR